MARVITLCGYIDLNAPPYCIMHPYPSDFWRFHPDYALALASWSAQPGIPLDVLESFVASRYRASERTASWCLVSALPRSPSRLDMDATT